MELTLFVARVAALVYLLVGLGMLFNSSYYKTFADNFEKERMALYTGGFMALIAGFAIVSYHNVWTANWTVLITLIGWIGLVKGILIFIFPKATIKLSQKMLKNPVALSPGILILGCVLGYFGFIAS